MRRRFLSTALHLTLLRRPGSRSTPNLQCRQRKGTDTSAMNHVMDRPIWRPWWRKKHWVQLGLAAGVLALGVATAVTFFGTAERSVRMSSANVTLAKVTQGAFHDLVPLRAKVVPLNTIYLDALEGGRVERVLAQAGDTV